MIRRSLPFLLIFLTTSSSSSKFDNEIVGLPRVFCERANIRVKVQTARPFEGRFFVKGEFHTNGCGMSYSNGSPVPAKASIIMNGETEPSDETEWKSRGTAFPPRARPGFPLQKPNIAIGGSKEGKGSHPHIFSPSRSSCPSAAEICPPCKCDSLHRQRREEANWAELVVPLGACNAKRDRVINPPSLVTSFVAIVSFHGSFITKVDRAYHIKCAFNESILHVDADLNVTMKDSASLSGESLPPSCEYRLLGADGHPLHHVKVGDLVRHEWRCKGAPSSRVLVHDCYAEDGHGNTHRIIDEHGCTLDEYTIPTPEYDDKTLTSHVNAYIFQFPDQSSVSFQCSIRSCTGLDENCRDMSPPHCGSTRQKRSTPLGSEAMVIHSPTLTVYDLDRAVTVPNRPEALTADPESFCLSLIMFGSAISLTTFLVTSSIGVVLIQTCYTRSL